MGWGQITISLDGCVHVVRFFNRASINRFFYLGYGWVSFLSMYRYCGYPCCGTLFIPLDIYGSPRAFRRWTLLE